MEQNEIKVHKQIMAKTGNKLKKSMSYCSCNECSIGNVQERLAKAIEKDKFRYKIYMKNIINFRNFLNDLTKNETSTFKK